MAKQVFELTGEEISKILAHHFVDKGMMPSGKYDLNLEVKGVLGGKLEMGRLTAEKK